MRWSMSPACCLGAQTSGTRTRGANQLPDFVEHKIGQDGSIAPDLLSPVQRTIRGCKHFRIRDQAMLLHRGDSRADTDGDGDRRLIRGDRTVIHGRANPLRAVFNLFPRATGEYDHELLSTVAPD